MTPGLCRLRQLQTGERRIFCGVSPRCAVARHSRRKARARSGSIFSASVRHPRQWCTCAKRQNRANEWSAPAKQQNRRMGDRYETSWRSLPKSTSRKSVHTVPFLLLLGRPTSNLVHRTWRSRESPGEPSAPWPPSPLALHTHGSDRATNLRRGHRDPPPLTPLNSNLTCRTLLRHAALCAGNQVGLPGSSGPRWSRQASSVFAGPRCAHASRERSTPIDPPLFFRPIPRSCLVCVPATRTKAAARTPASLTRARSGFRSAFCCAANEAE